MRIWSILFIKSNLKWCLHLSRSPFIYSRFVAKKKLFETRWMILNCCTKGRKQGEGKKKRKNEWKIQKRKPLYRRCSIVYSSREGRILCLIQCLINISYSQISLSAQNEFSRKSSRCRPVDRGIRVCLETECNIMTC